MTFDQGEFDLSYSEQWRASRLQLIDWGTFSGYHSIPFAREGHLIAGRSGSGKSTLLDAVSALLIPKRILDFNAAAREQDRRGRDRNLVSYVRGAWGTRQDDESGEYTTSFLRPNSTWSALGLSFENGRGRTLSLAQIVYIRGNSVREGEVHRLFMIFERPLDLREFAAFDLDVRKLKRSFPDDFCETEFGPYQERYTRLLGIENSEALKLLHKTQSAKNLGDLNAFLRDYMLDRPGTFEAAEHFTREFAELNDAHRAVVSAREQIAVLEPARAALSRVKALGDRQNELREAQVGLNLWTEQRRATLWRERLAVLEADVAGAAGRASAAEEAYQAQQKVERELDRLVWEGGGARVDGWEKELSDLEAQRRERLRRREQAEAQCRALDRQFPADAENFSRLVAEAKQELIAWQEKPTVSEEWRSLAFRKEELGKNLEQVDTEIRSLESQPSNIPREFLEMRRRICSELGGREQNFPFAGELLQVRESERPWRGAIERLLRGFALSILVDDRDYPSFSRVVNGINLGQRLVYHRVTSASSSGSPGEASVPLKVEIKEGPWKGWLEAELANSFNYRCVDSSAAFVSEERAITREGQVKHNKKRHEKNDRFRVDDQTQWVLGFDNAEKLQLYRNERKKLEEELSGLGSRLDALERDQRAAATRIVAWNQLANSLWREVDVVSLIARSAELQGLIEEVKNQDGAFRELSGRLEAQRGSTRAAGDAFVRATSERDRLRQSLSEGQEKLMACEAEVGTARLTPLQRGEIDRLISSGGTTNLDNLDRRRSEMGELLSREAGEVQVEKGECHQLILASFRSFLATWPVESQDLEASIDGASDFMSRLDRLVVDDLPSHESRFYQMLRKQSFSHIASLASLLDRTRKDITHRLSIVNESLTKSRFEDGWLRIDSREKTTEEIRLFRTTLREIQDGALNDDQEGAEARFERVRDLVERLSSPTDADKRWRELVLDVRQHVEFIAREVDSQGKDIEVFQSGSGKSGGQRQKLAATCLAAALRYQLGGKRYGSPRFAMIVMDEAFDKTDSDFTKKVIEIFTNFGFQMIMATPMKAIMSLEPYIGGACYVGINDRNNSGTLTIDYDTETRRLRLKELPRDPETEDDAVSE